jgi:large subunit ribosomal protein L9
VVFFNGLLETVESGVDGRTRSPEDGLCRFPARKEGPVPEQEDLPVKVILREDVSNVGKTGDTIVVADGYGRNFLLPRGLAVQASTKNVKMLEHQKKLIQARQSKLRQESQDLAKRLEAVSCTIARKAGEEDKLYGSVTARDIADAVKQQGILLDRKRILLSEPIKKLGVFSVSVQLHPDIVGNVKVSVVKP